MAKDPAAFKIIPDPLDDHRIRRADWIGNWGGIWVNAVAAALTLAGIAFAYCAGVDAKHEQRRLQASAAYSDYLKLAIEHPEAATPNSLAYPAYVAYLLFACERVLVSYRGDASWEGTCSGEMSMHREYLNSPAFREVQCTFSADVRTMVDQVTGAPGPDCQSP